jgi:hypothetical protein
MGETRVVNGVLLKFVGGQWCKRENGEWVPVSPEFLGSGQNVTQHSNCAGAEVKLPPVCQTCDYLDKCSYRTPEFCEHPSRRQLLSTRV